MFCLSVGEAFAQWETQIGVNLLPLTVRSFEISSEFSRNPHLAITAQAGYLHKTGFTVIWDDKVGDGVGNRRTSGAFYKIGARYYFLKSTVKPRKVTPFIGAMLIGSHYAKTADSSYYSTPLTGERIYTKISRKGFSWGPSMTIGLSFRLSNRLSLDGGMQYSYMINNDDWIGSKARNYEPGFGIRTVGLIPTSYRQRKFLPTNNQAIVTLKYKI